MAPVIKPKNKKQRNKPIVEVSPEKEENATAVVSGQLQKKIKKQQKRQQRQRGVLFVKNLPHGFFEEQIQNFFEQFGEVTRLRLVRSRRTGGSKGYAFVEFDYPEVAQVAAETMNNYLMFKKVVKASYIPPENQKFNLFKSSVRQVTNKAGKEIFVSNKIKAINKKVKENNKWSEEAYDKSTKAQLRKIQKLNAKYGNTGIDFGSILVGPKKLANDNATDNSENNSKPAKIVKSKNLTKKAGKENVAEEKKIKKTKKEIKLADLLANTLDDDDDPDDDDFEISDSEKGKEIELKDLLGQSLMNDSDEDDEDFAVTPTNSSDSNNDNNLEEEYDSGSETEEGTEETPKKKGLLKQQQNKAKKVTELKDLLGESLLDDSDDDNDFEMTTANISNDSEDDEEDEESTEEAPKKKGLSKKQNLKAKKFEKVDLLDQLVKRKAHPGGIQKLSKKAAKKPIKKEEKAKIAMKLAAAKEMATSSIKLGLKDKKNLKKQKKAA